MVLLVISLLLAATGMLSVHMLPFHPIVSYTAAFIVSSAVFLWAAYLLVKHEMPARMVYAFIGVGLLVRLSFLWTQPIGSDDLYRYWWDGRVQASGVNPYAYAPNSEALKHLWTPEIPSRVNHPELKTLYFPLSEWIFYASYSLSGESVWGIKVLLLISEVCSLWGLLLLTGKLGVPGRFVLFYALCPMLVFEFALDAHVDAFGLPFLIFALFFYFDKKKLLAMLFLGLSLLVKPTLLVLLPVLFFAESKWKARFAVALIPLAVLGAVFAPYFLSANPLEALTTFTKNWTFNGFVFNALNEFVRNNQTSRLICSVLLALAVLALSLSKRDVLEKIYFAVLLLLLFSPVVHPWYVGWLAALVPVARKWSGILFLALLSLTCFTLISFQLDGVWGEEPVWWLMEYIPVAAAFVLELTRFRVAPAAGQY